MGRALHDDGKPAEAVTWYDQALRLAEDVLKQNAHFPKARLLQSETLQSRAKSLDELKQQAEKGPSK
jgi:hypothetical protein